MDCIRCGGAMEKRPERGVLLDHCRSCSAVWLDAGELEVLERGAGRDAARLEAERAAETEREGRRSVVALGLCPRCQRGLELRTLRGVEVDQCRRCGGIFFDHRELAAVLASRDGERSPRRRSRRDPG